MQPEAHRFADFLAALQMADGFNGRLLLILTQEA
jgi:hypothetical protein